MPPPRWGKPMDFEMMKAWVEVHTLEDSGLEGLVLQYSIICKSPVPDNHTHLVQWVEANCNDCKAKPEIWGPVYNIGQEK